MILVLFADHHCFNSLLHDALHGQKNWYAVMASFQCEDCVHSAIVEIILVSCPVFSNAAKTSDLILEVLTVKIT